MSVTVVITTRNRKRELAVALQSALEQTANPEVLVIDDASQDGTAEMVRSEYPAARLERCEAPLGYIAQRNRAARLVTGEILVSIDDDAKFSTSRVVEQTIRNMDNERVGAVAIPYRDVNQNDILHQKSPDERQIWVADRFVGTAHAVRRDVFLKVGGYRDFLVHQGEEVDFCLRMLALGYVTRLGTSDPVEHFESQKRDFRRMDFYGRRNDVLFAWQNVPMPWLMLHLPATAINGVRAAWKCGRLRYMTSGLVGGFADVLSGAAPRRPVSADTYRLSRELKTSGGLPLAAIEHRL